MKKFNIEISEQEKEVLTYALLDARKKEDNWAKKFQGTQYVNKYLLNSALINNIYSKLINE
jgi:hypothetical protein